MNNNAGYKLCYLEKDQSQSHRAIDPGLKTPLSALLADWRLAADPPVCVPVAPDTIPSQGSATHAIPHYPYISVSVVSA